MAVGELLQGNHLNEFKEFRFRFKYVVWPWTMTFIELSSQHAYATFSCPSSLLVSFRHREKSLKSNSSSHLVNLFMAFSLLLLFYYCIKWISIMLRNCLLSSLIPQSLETAVPEGLASGCGKGRTVITAA